jgi:hypothetical protein
MSIAAPTGLSATVVNGGRIDLNWTDNSTTEDGHKIERSPNGSSNWVQIGTVGPNVTSYSATGLTAYTIYYFRVRAYEGGSNSAYSSNASGVPTPLVIAAPDDMIATAVSATQIDLEWDDNSTGEANQTIQRSLSSSSGFANLVVVAADVESYSDTTCSPGVTYYYRVKADDGPYSNKPSATTFSIAAPSGLNATAFSSTQIDLTWTDNTTTETQFKVERSLDGSTGWTQIGTNSANDTTYSDTGLTPGTTYYYRVRAFDGSINSAYSGTANAATPANLTAPSSVVATAQSGGTQINLTWTDNSTGEDGFRIERSLDGSTGWTEITATAANATSYNDTGLSPLTQYYYRIRAYDGLTNGSYSTSANATTLFHLLAPTSVIANPVSNTAIDVSWTDTSTGETGHKVERSLNGTTGWTEIGTPAAGVNTYSDTGLAGDTTYYYRVRAYNGGTNGAYSSNGSGTTTAVLNDPTVLTATTISATQIDLAWVDNSVGEDGVKIERSADGSTGWTQIATVGPNATTYSNTGLTGATTYYYRVRSYDGVVNSGYSNTANATTSAVLAAPTLLSATGDGATTINLAWTNNSAGEDGHQIYYGINGTSYSFLANAPAGANTYAVTGLLTNQGYYFKVRAYSGATTTAYSNAAFANTGFTTPTGLTATGVSSTRINLAWSAPLEGQAGYKIERSLNPSSGFVQIATTYDTVYGDEGLSPSTTYYYRVRSYDESVHSSYSAVAGGTTSLVAPSGLSATPISASQVDLAWTDNSTGETGFRVQVSINGTSGWSTIATTAANATTYSDTTVLPLVTYYYRVLAITATTASSPSNVAAAEVPAELNAPTDLLVDAISTTALRLTWTNTSLGQDGTKIERSANGTTGWSQIATVLGSANTYDNTALSTTTNYYYRVRSYYESLDSAYSEVQGGRTGLIAPTGLEVTETSSTVNDLTWIDNSADEDGFEIQYSLDGETGWASAGANNAANDTTFTDSALPADNGYFYRVRAYKGTIYSAWSLVASASVPVVMVTPGNFNVVVASANQADLTWLDTNVGEEGYKIERSPNGSTGWTVIATTAADVASYSDTTIAANTTYYYRVRAFAGNTYSSYAGPLSINTGTALLPPPLTAYAMGPTVVQMFWTNPNPSATAYELQRSTAPASGFATIATITNLNATFYDDTGLTTDTAYYYRIRTVHPGAFFTTYSPWSPVAGATTGVILAAPANLFAQLDYPPGTLSVYLGWADVSGGEDGYKIERSPAGAGTWTQIDTVLAPFDAAYRDDGPGLVAGSSYDYRVRAYSGVTNGPYSATVTVTFADLNTPPSGLSATAIAWNRVDLEWTDTSGGLGYPMVQRSLNGTTWTDLWSLPLGTEAFSDTATAPNTTYYYRVYYQNDPPPISYSSPASVTTTYLLYAPANLRGYPVVPGTIGFSWENWNYGVTDQQSTKVEKSLNGVDGWTQVAVLNPQQTIYNESGVDPDTTYYYRVRFYYGTYKGHSPYSEVLAVTSSDDLAMPLNVTAVQSGGLGSISSYVSWDDEATGEDGYQIQRARFIEGPWEDVGTAGPNGTTFFDTGLAGGGNYFYRVRAYKGNTYSLWNTGSMEMQLATPTGLAAIASSDSQINLTWTDTNLGEDGYSIERSLDGSTWAVVGTTDGSSYSDIGLAPITTYYYRVRAFSGAFYSEYSNTDSDTTDIRRFDAERGDRLRTRRVHDLVAEPQSGYVLNPERSFFSIVVEEESVNLVTDPEMRHGTDYSGVGGAVATRQSEVQRRGIYGYEVYTYNAGGGLRYTLPANLTANQPYTFSLDLKGPGTYTLYFATASGAPVGRRQIVNGTTFWQRASLSTYITDSTVRTVTVVANEPQIRFYVGGFQVENLDHATTFIAGSLRTPAEPGYAWLGTPHRSMSYRGPGTDGGRVVPFSDLGFEIMEFIALGYGEQTNLYEEYASRSGSYYHGTRNPLRSFSLIGNLSASGLYELMEKRFAIGSRVTGKGETARPVTIVCQLFDCGEPLTEEAAIRCVYKSGLEGTINNLYQERIAITFESGDPLLSAFGNRGAALTLTEEVDLPGRMIAINSDGVVSGLPAYSCRPERDARPPRPLIASDNNLYQACGDYLNVWNGYNWQIAYTTSNNDQIMCAEMGPDGKIYFAVARVFNSYRVYSYDLATGVVDNLHNTQILARDDNPRPVRVIRRAYGGNLIFGGSIMFVQNDFTPQIHGLFNLARYDPFSGKWSAVFGGVGLDVTYNNYVNDILFDHRGFMWVGGHFRNDAVAEQGIIKDLAVLVNGTWCDTGFWTSEEGDARAEINALGIHRETGIIYVGGNFDEVDPQIDSLAIGDLDNVCAIHPSDMRTGFLLSNSSVPTTTHIVNSVTKLRTGPGFRIPPAPMGYQSEVLDLAVSCDNHVAFVGSFDSVSNLNHVAFGLSPAPGVAIWDGKYKRWEPAFLDLVPHDIGSGFFYYRSWSVAYGGQCDTGNVTQGTGLGVLTPAFVPSGFGLGTQPGMSNTFFFNASNATEATSAAVNVLSNRCGVAVRPEIEVTGPCQLDSIRNYTTEKSLIFRSFVIYAGETVTLRMEPGMHGAYSSTRGDVSDFIATSSAFPDFELIAGDNDIVVKLTEAGPAASVNFRWPQRYASLDAFTQETC